jgi:hypothetical protein
MQGLTERPVQATEDKASRCACFEKPSIPCTIQVPLIINCRLIGTCTCKRCAVRIIRWHLSLRRQQFRPPSMFVPYCFTQHFYRRYSGLYAALYSACAPKKASPGLEYHYIGPVRLDLRHPSNQSVGPANPPEIRQKLQQKTQLAKGPRLGPLAPLANDWEAPVDW